jgi:anion-transporting  ArsA/GET3 family ATPase
VVTVTGPGGAGKSTIALAAARERAAEPGAEATFVELAPARHRADFVRAFAEATGVEGAGDGAVLATVLSARPVGS